MNVFRKMKWALPLAMVLALVFAGAALAAVAVIDHFDVAQTLVVQCDGTRFAVDSVEDLEVLGDERDVIAQITLCFGSDPLEVTINNGGNSVYNYLSGNNIYGYSQIQWDGNNDPVANKEVIDYEGLGGEDLTALGTLDRFIVGTSSNDLPATLIITVYTNENDWSSKTLVLPGGISGQNPQVFEILFSAFDTHGGIGATFSNAGAVVMEIDGRATPSLDSTIHLVGIADENYLDFGDLPDSYDTLLNPGPRNVIEGPILGTQITAETEGQPDPDADLDGGDDGVAPSPGVQWTVATGGSIDVEVSNCPIASTCRLVGFIDWNQDGNFYDGIIYNYDLGEQILVDYPVNNGDNLGITFSIPAGTDIANGSTNSYFYARFRVYERNSGGAAIPSWVLFTGETEDYRLGFYPTLVTLTNLNQKETTTTPIIIAVTGALLLLASGGALLAYKRRRA